METYLIPEYLKPKANYSYPRYCKADGMLEEVISNTIEKVKTDRIYLPILWTNYYVMNGYEKGDHSALHRFMESLPKDQRYWTVIQYDDGILKDYGLNILTFAAGGVGDVPIPLLPSHVPLLANKEKHKKVSFIGNPNTHPIRANLTRTPEIDYYNGLNPDQYLQKLNEYRFTFAPRGYGKTSFRLYEALALETIPIYLSDEHWLPMQEFIDWSEIAIICKSIQEGLDKMDNIDNEVMTAYYRASIRNVRQHLTMQGVLNYIKYYLEND